MGAVCPSRQRDQHALGHVLLRQSDLARLEPVHIHVDGRLRDLLVDVGVGDSGDSLHLFQQFLRQFVIALIVAGDL